MPYLAWRIPFLSTLNFNANALRWQPYSSSCFDIILHFSVCVLVYYFLENQKGDLSAPLYTTVLSTCWLLRKAWCDWTLCGTGALPVLGASADVRKGKGELEPGPGVSGRREERRIGGSSEAPSPDPRSRAGIKVACFMWLVRDFEVLESPTALTSSSSLVS